MDRKEVYMDASEVAKIIGCDPQELRSQAQSKPHLLGFPVCVIGSRVKIPRKPFLRFWGIENMNREEEKSDY